MNKANRILTRLCENILSKVSSDKSEEVANILARVGSVFHTTVEHLLSSELEQCLKQIKESKRQKGSFLINCLSCITVLASGGQGLCRLLVREGLVGILVNLLNESEKVIILRALGYICCVTEGIREITQHERLEVIVNLLRNSQDEKEQREAVGVIAQVTSPWIEDEMSREKIIDHIPSIVESVKGIIFIIFLDTIHYSFFRPSREDHLTGNLSSLYSLYCSHHNYPPYIP